MHHQVTQDAGTTPDIYRLSSHRTTKARGEAESLAPLYRVRSRNPIKPEGTYGLGQVGASPPLPTPAEADAYLVKPQATVATSTWMPGPIVVLSATFFK
jgi:hypothetical protein